MCGIVGYIGEKDAYPIIIKGLQRLEYRGYDSAGIALSEGSDITILKQKGKVSDLEDYAADKNRKGTIPKADIEAIFDINWNDHEKIKKIQKELRTKNVAVVTNQAWTELYVLPGGVKLDTSTEDLSDVQVGAKKGELKRAFGKMTSGRKNQRPLLNKFIGMIA